MKQIIIEQVVDGSFRYYPAPKTVWDLGTELTGAIAELERVGIEPTHYRKGGVLTALTARRK